jgi:PRD1 phage membrane DNA delivery
VENNLINQIFTVLTAIVGVAIIAVLVSQKAQTGTVISAGGNAFAQGLEAAVSPITGNSPAITGGSTFGGAAPLNLFQ